MKLGFVSAILPDSSLEEVLELAAREHYDCVELMCWPAGTADRRYAGVSHLDVVDFGADDAARVNELCARHGVALSGLGYYPNALDPDPDVSRVAIGHIGAVVRAARLLGVNQVNTFIGRDWKRTVDDNWPRFLEVWRPLVKLAEAEGVKIGIENCPMFFGADEWPGGKNLATTPAIWRRMFEDIESECFGLNYDPSHLIWQQIDPIQPLFEFGDLVFHVHAKDVRMDRRKLDDVGVLAYPGLTHHPKLPGNGELDFDLPPGSKTLLVGPTASGRSALLEVLAGWRPRHAGSVRWDGHSK